MKQDGSEPHAALGDIDPAGPTLEQVAAIVARIAEPQHGSVVAGPDTPLTDGGFWLDSVQLLETIIACEDTFGVIFDPETDLTDESLRTIQTLFDLVRVKRTA